MNVEKEIFINRQQFRFIKKSRFAACCVTCSLLITPVIYVIVIIINTKTGSDLKFDSLWFPLTGSESCVRLVDINEDGLDDVVVAVSAVTTISKGRNNDTNRSSFCESIHVEEPCSGTVYGIRGYDFTILWSFQVKASIFELACNGIDINADGFLDCIATGRQGTLVAFDPRFGKVLWHNNQIKSRNLLWNFYNPLFLPVDVDHDNINDILVAHGGNPTIPSDVHEREAGCLLIISGRTGNQIGEPFWMPDGKETYMSPVLYGKSTILFGTGGETVSGGLYSISIDNIIQQRNQYITLFKSFEKGVMVPPIILDIDRDEVDDILVSCFDGTLQLINGRTVKPLWTRIFSGFEFYASPAPGDINGDSFVDFMIILNHGEWDRYDFSQTLIVDGLTGKTIWSRTNQFAEFVSPLTLQMTRNRKYQDSFIYQQRGLTIEPIQLNASSSSSSSSSSLLIHGIGLQDGEISKDENLNIFKSNSSCHSFTLNDSIVNIYLTSVQVTQLIAVIYPPINKKDNHCSNYEPMERSGIAIGDLNGDNILDIVDITTFITKLASHNLHNFTVHSVLTRFSLSTNKGEYQMVANYQEDIFNKSIDQNLLHLLRQKVSFSLGLVHKKGLHVVSKQTWNSYLGRFSNSHYYQNI